MASIIKVDTIQTAAGGTPTAGDLGLNTTGSVLQVVQGTRASDTTIQSGAYTSTGLSVNITPTYADSKILVTLSLVVDARSNAKQVNIAVFRDSTNLTLNPSHSRQRGSTIYSESSRIIAPVSFSVLDEPNTTSQITYEVRGFENSSTQFIAPAQTAGGYIQAIEIAG